MGDMGDYWREARDYRRAARSQWHECPSAGCQFGGNPVKVAPGGRCRHCGWIAPGQRGEDARYARKRVAEIAADQDRRDRDRALTMSKRTCKLCGKRLATIPGCEQHMRDKHGSKEAPSGQA